MLYIHKDESEDVCLAKIVSFFTPEISPFGHPACSMKAAHKPHLDVVMVWMRESKKDRATFTFVLSKKLNEHSKYVRLSMIILVCV